MGDQIYKIGSVPPFCFHSNVGQGIYRLEIPSPFCLHTNVGQEYVLCESILYFLHTNVGQVLWDLFIYLFLFIIIYLLLLFLRVVTFSPPCLNLVLEIDKLWVF